MKAVIDMDAIKQILQRILDGDGVADDFEGLTLEFKTDGRSIQDDLVNLADAAACFANSSGGDVVVGIANKLYGKAALIGTRLDPEKTRLRIYEITTPPLLVETESLWVEDKQILILRVPQSTQVHSSHGKLPSERVEQNCFPMSSQRISEVIAMKTGRDWSAGQSNVTAAEVDPVAMQVARDMLQRATDESKRRLVNASDIDLLRALGVVMADQMLTNAGALLFSRAYENRPLVSYTHRRTPAGQLTSNEQFSGPLIVAIDRVFDLISARLETTPVFIGKGQQLHITDLPEAAIREALINGIMHREYYSLDRTSVEHTTTQLRVVSPGGLLPGISTENILTTSSRTRNTNLANALRMLGLAETAGSGVDKMYAEMTRIGHQPPHYIVDPTKVVVTLLGGAPNAPLANYVATLPPEEASDADSMLTLLTLLTKRTVSAEEAKILLQKASFEEAQSVLLRLSGGRLKMLEPTRETVRKKFPKYRLHEDAITALGSAVTYRRRTTDQVDRKVIELVRETGTINSRMVKILLDLDTPSASRVLADLVERQVLVKTSAATRGPSVTYGKGKKFPSRGNS